ncbi:hypothetical protein ACFWFI_28525 [Streptomyces sp. NPDC060209]|uniref:hypothetical protein n=1 Tax=Streptomyces sp. NPDC060209 TaxID=3347073 RepID=UPI003658A087
MPETDTSHTAADCLQRLRDEAMAMFTEVQRADTKATALCGVAGGLLAVDAAVLAAVPRSERLVTAVLAVSGVLLGAALIMGMTAIRPVLPRGNRLRVFACSASGLCRADVRLPAGAMAVLSGHLRAETERLELFTLLAQRKFRAVKRTVDFIASALVVAGFGLLILYITG